MALTAPFAAVTGRVSSTARSMGQSVAVYAVIALIGLVGIGFLISALYIWLAQETSPLGAALLMGAGFIAIAGISLAIVVARNNRKKEERRRDAANTAMMASTVSLASAGLRIASIRAYRIKEKAGLSDRPFLYLYPSAIIGKALGLHSLSRVRSASLRIPLSGWMELPEALKQLCLGSVGRARSPAISAAVRPPPRHRDKQGHSFRSWHLNGHAVGSGGFLLAP